MIKSTCPGFIQTYSQAAPESLNAADVLQRTIGNRAVGRLLAEIGRLPSRQAPVQQMQRRMRWGTVLLRHEVRKRTCRKGQTSVLYSGVRTSQK